MDWRESLEQSLHITCHNLEGGLVAYGLHLLNLDTLILELITGWIFSTMKTTCWTLAKGCRRETPDGRLDKVGQLLEGVRPHQDTTEDLEV